MYYYQLDLDNLIQVHFVDDTTWEDAFSHKKRKPGEYIVYGIRRGVMYLEENKERYVLREGDVIILDKDMTHVGFKASLCSYWYVHFKSDNMRLLKNDKEDFMKLLAKDRMQSAKSDIFSYEETAGRVVNLPKYSHLDEPGFLKFTELLEKARECNYKPMENYKMLCALYIEEAMIFLSRNILTAADGEFKELSVKSRRVYEVIEWISEHYSEEITGERISELFDCNYDYLNRTFKKITGKTVLQQLTETRIGHAKNLLMHTSLKVGDVGKRVGFGDEYYFNRVFKKYVGVPPGSLIK